MLSADSPPLSHASSAHGQTSPLMFQADPLTTGCGSPLMLKSLPDSPRRYRTELKLGARGVDCGRPAQTQSARLITFPQLGEGESGSRSKLRMPCVAMPQAVEDNAAQFPPIITNALVKTQPHHETRHAAPEHPVIPPHETSRDDGMDSPRRWKNPPRPPAAGGAAAWNGSDGGSSPPKRVLERGSKSFEMPSSSRRALGVERT